MVDIITNIGWGLAAAVVGAVVIVVGTVILLAPFLGVIILFEKLEVKEQILQRARWMRGKGDAAVGVFIIVACLAMATCIGASTIDWSEDTFGWPDAPSWMNTDTDEKNGC